VYVYVLQTENPPVHYYVGKSNDPRKRLEEHNAGKSTHTNKHRPWKLIVAVWFDNDDKANTFERYLKTGSGRAFCKRHF